MFDKAYKEVYDVWHSNGLAFDLVIGCAVIISMNKNNAPVKILYDAIGGRKIPEIR